MSEESSNTGPRPDGVRGLLIDEIEIKGISKARGGFLAQVEVPSSSKSYLLRVGDQLFDGEVVLIRSSDVVFKQVVNDPVKPFREVVKGLSV